MLNPIQELVSLGGAALRAPSDLGAVNPITRIRNGFFAFESALWVFPSDMIPEWNRVDGWRSSYGALPEGANCFAADLFGNQFATVSDTVFRLEVETGEVELFAESVDDWAAVILNDFDFHTGYSLAHSWQAAIRPLSDGERLAPNRPFVLGGEYEFDNLAPFGAAELMMRFGPFAQSLVTLPDGAPVTFDEKNFVVRAHK